MKKLSKKISFAVLSALMLFSCTDKYNEETLEVIVPRIKNRSQILDVAKVEDPTLKVRPTEKQINGVSKKKKQAPIRAIESKVNIEKNVDNISEAIPNVSEDLLKEDPKVVEALKEIKNEEQNKLSSDGDPQIGREELNEKWKSLKLYAKQKGFSQEDFSNLVPETLSINNYLKFGDFKKTYQKLLNIEKTLKEARISKLYLKSKVRKIISVIKESNLSQDDKSEFKVRLVEVQQLVSNSQYGVANKELNEMLIDLKQYKSVDNAFEN